MATFRVHFTKKDYQYITDVQADNPNQANIQARKDNGIIVITKTKLLKEHH